MALKQEQMRHLMNVGDIRGYIPEDGKGKTITQETLFRNGSRPSKEDEIEELIATGLKREDAIQRSQENVSQRRI